MYSTGTSLPGGGERLKKKKEEARWEEGRRLGWIDLFTSPEGMRLCCCEKKNLYEEKRLKQEEKEGKKRRKNKTSGWSITRTAYWSRLNRYFWDATLPPRYSTTTWRRKSARRKMTKAALYLYVRRKTELIAVKNYLPFTTIAVYSCFILPL